VRELTPREPVWRDGEFVDRPVHTGGAVPQWSRWEASATTVGPWGRIFLTAGLFATLLVAAMFGMFMFVIWFPVIAIVGLRGIWAKGWVIRREAATSSTERAALPAGWLWDPADLIRSALFLAVALAAVATVLYVPNAVVRFVVIVASVVVGGAATLRWVRGDR